ncbi:MAG: alanine racemase, partial [Acidimicrobiales bacterium]
MVEASRRPAWAEIDVSALTANLELLSALVAPARVCAVVKADAYGHGAPRCAKALVESGTPVLAVGCVDEGIELREAGIEAPVLVLSEATGDALSEALASRLTPTVSSAEGMAALEHVRDDLRGFGAHLKVDTGMHRLGFNPKEAPEALERLETSLSAKLEGVWTHLAVADGEEKEAVEFTARQLSILASVVASVDAGVVRHAANSAGAIACPVSRLDMVRLGIALYGELPAPWLARSLGAQTAGGRLRPVLSLKARVVAVRELEAGDRPSYGRLRPLLQRSLVATVPLGYADGVPRRLFEAGGEVLIGGRRRSLAGAVTMDQIVVDCGPLHDVACGDEVVLIGRQGREVISAAAWAALLGTIPYEVLTG